MAASRGQRARWVITAAERALLTGGAIEAVGSSPWRVEAAAVDRYLRKVRVRAMPARDPPYQGRRASTVGEGRVTAAAAARILDVDHTTVAGWCRAGLLPAHQTRPNGPWSIDAAAVTRPAGPGMDGLLSAANVAAILQLSGPAVGRLVDAGRLIPSTTVPLAFTQAAVDACVAAARARPPFPRRQG